MVTSGIVLTRLLLLFAARIQKVPVAVFVCVCVRCHGRLVRAAPHSLSERVRSKCVLDNYAWRYMLALSTRFLKMWFERASHLRCASQQVAGALDVRSVRALPVRQTRGSSALPILPIPNPPSGRTMRGHPILSQLGQPERFSLKSAKTILLVLQEICRNLKQKWYKLKSMLSRRGYPLSYTMSECTKSYQSAFHSSIALVLRFSRLTFFQRLASFPLKLFS